MDESIDFVRRVVPATETHFVASPPTDFLLLVDGVSFLLYSDGSSKIILMTA